jgi:hypothetical protein
MFDDAPSLLGVRSMPRPSARLWSLSSAPQFERRTSPFLSFVLGLDLLLLLDHGLRRFGRRGRRGHFGEIGALIR